MISDAKKYQCVGTHIQGFCTRKNPFNYASPIGGIYGNPYNALLEAIDEEPKSTSEDWWEVPLPFLGSTGQVQNLTPENPKIKPMWPALFDYHYRTLFLVDDIGLYEG